MTEVVVLADAEAVAAEAERRVVAVAAAAIGERKRFSLCLAGGSTPRRLYERLAARPDAIDWPHTHIFFGDERCVSPSHPFSNYRMAFDTLIEHVPAPTDHVHRIEGENGDPYVAAAAYETELMKVLGNRPVFDLVLLGLGVDGHTASLFPDNPALAERARLCIVVAEPGSEPRVPRITLTYPPLRAARALLFLVAGPDKAEALAQTLAETPGPFPVPAHPLVHLGQEVTILCDESAAAQLPR